MDTTTLEKGNCPAASTGVDNCLLKVSKNSFLGMCTKEMWTHGHTEGQVPQSLTQLYLTAKNGNQVNCPSRVEWITIDLQRK